MSEYQFYEFQAIDRPLGEQARAELRSVSSRARITPTSLTNVYHFGDFKGDPDRLMDRYFDAHLYLANWGTRRLMLRVPAASLPLASAKPYAAADVVRTRATREHVVLDFHSECEGDDDLEDGEGVLASLVPVRADLMAGDFRCLYLGWLLGVEAGEVDDAAVEPPVPPGLGRLNAPLERFADFLRLDPDLLEVAAGVSDDGPNVPPAADLAAWVAALPRAEADRALVRLMCGEGGPVAGELLRRFRESRPRRPGGEARRTAGELIRARDRVAAVNRRKHGERAAREQDRRAREEQAARARHLDSLAGREEELWREVEAAIGARQAKEYDRAVELLKDLRDLAARAGAGDAVAGRIRELRGRHRGKPTLMQRMDKAGLPA